MVFMLLIALSKDGRWLQFSQVQLHLYLEMLKVFGLDWMLQDEEWKDAVWAADIPKTGEFWDKLYEAVQSKTLAEWNEVFENDHDVWAETMRRGSELLDHPQMQHLGAVVEIDDAERGLVRQPGPIVKMSETPAVLATGCTIARCGRRRAAGRARGRRSAAPDVVAGCGLGSAEARRLGDVTLLELGTFFAAPFGGTVLREVGARVDQGRADRTASPCAPCCPFPSSARRSACRARSRICVDLSTDEGRAIVHALARRSDIVLQSFRAGVAKRQGVDADTLRADQPGPRLPQLARLRHRRALRRPPRLRADHRCRAAASSCATSAPPSRSDRVCRCRRSGPTPCGSPVRARRSTPRPTASRR